VTLSVVVGSLYISLAVGAIFSVTVISGISAVVLSAAGFLLATFCLVSAVASGAANIRKQINACCGLSGKGGLV
jgi:hypothetical protein